MGRERVGRRVVDTTSESKVLFPDPRITKGELIGYYRDVAPTMVRYLRDRPLAMRRYPSGITSGGFIQQAAPDSVPDWVRTAIVDKADGSITHVLCNDAPTLVYLANQNMVTPHVWLSRVDRPRHPDQIVFDLDPATNDFEQVRFAARAVREMLEEDGFEVFAMTTGSKGVHVRVALRRGADFDRVREYARDRAEALAEQHPDALTTEQRKDKRGDRVYLDVGRNAYGQTAVPPYAVRALPGAPVATPITWDELEDSATTARRFTIRDVPGRLASTGDPMQALFSHPRALPKSLHPTR